MLVSQIKYLRKTEDKQTTKNNKIEIEEKHIDHTTNEVAMHVDSNVKITLQNYFDAKFQLLRHFKRVTTINQDNCLKKSDINEMIIQEINILAQLTENP